MSSKIVMQAAAFAAFAGVAATASATTRIVDRGLLLKSMVDHNILGADVVRCEQPAALNRRAECLVQEYGESRIDGFASAVSRRLANDMRPGPGLFDAFRAAGVATYLRPDGVRIAELRDVKCLYLECQATALTSDELALAPSIRARPSYEARDVNGTGEVGIYQFNGLVSDQFYAALQAVPIFQYASPRSPVIGGPSGFAPLPPPDLNRGTLATTIARVHAESVTCRDDVCTVGLYGAGEVAVNADIAAAFNKFLHGPQASPLAQRLGHALDHIEDIDCDRDIAGTFVTGCTFNSK